MGNNQTSRVININNIESHLSECTQINTFNCPVYGFLHLVNYQSMDIHLGKSLNNHLPSHLHLHYLVPPNLLIIPSFTLLQNTKPQDFDQLLQLMTQIAKFLRTQDQIYIGRKRVAYANRWGLVGQQSANWPYKQAMSNKKVEGVYLSPQLIKQLSQQKSSPVHNPIKSDIFALGIMLIEIIFSENMSCLFDYVNYEIILKPLLQKLSIIRQQFGEEMYEVLIKTLQLQEQDRADFQQFYALVSQLNKKKMQTNETIIKKKCNNSNSRTHSNTKLNLNKRSPKQPNKSPDRVVSPRRRYRSPISKDLRINVIYGQNRSPQVNGRSPSSIKRNSFTPLTRR